MVFKKVRAYARVLTCFAFVFGFSNFSSPFRFVSCSRLVQLVVVDGRGHLLGRMASVVAKELLSGQKVVIVRSEECNISGSFFRNKRTYRFVCLPVMCL